MSLLPTDWSVSMDNRPTYTNHELAIVLKKGIGFDCFKANREDFLEMLRRRDSMPGGLRILIGKLFKRGVVIQCTIVYSTTMMLRLLPTSIKNLSFLDGILEQLEQAFSEIAEIADQQQLAANWRSSNCSDVIDSIVYIIERATELNVKEPDIKKFFSDSE